MPDERVDENVAVVRDSLLELTDEELDRFGCLPALDRLQARLEAAVSNFEALSVEYGRVEAERDEARADAERLRKAGRKLLDGLPSQEASAAWREAVRLHEALAAHEEQGE